MKVNAEKSGTISGVGMDKLKIVVDGPDRGSVDGQEAKNMARKEASDRGFGSGGLCEIPQTGPVGPDGEMLEGADALDPNIDLQGYRTEFMFAMRA